ncbi:MAG: haloalkane dehalogenase [Alphaproteobacteria bacterium]
MKVLRTPDDCFSDLPGYNFEPHYITIQDEDGTDLRFHYIDEGPHDAEPIVMIHGNPSWSYLHRKMIPGLLETGRRVISVDLIGLGRSDKPAHKDDYTLARHIDWLTKWMLGLDLTNITLFCQDWGGSIGLHLVANHPDRFDRVVAANTGLPLGEGGNPALDGWLAMMAEATAFPWEVFTGAMANNMADDVVAAYRAPFPSAEYEQGIAKFPVLIAIYEDNEGTPLNRAAWEKLKHFDKPFLTLWGDKDPISAGWNKAAQKHIAGCAGQAHASHPDAGHFIQEEAPDFLVERISKFLEVS